MNYELAKQLKDAGFPQQEPNGFVGILNHGADPDVYFPDLEELIEACGNGFIAIVRADDGSEYFATARGDAMFPPRHVGATPTEAVAMLWLALNKPTSI